MTTSRVAALVCAVALSAVGPCEAQFARYIRIYHVSDNPVNLINLDEVMPYDCMGQYIQPLRANMASPIPSWPASNCINLVSSGTGCHSTVIADSWLEIDLGDWVPVRNIVVNNRVDCCQDRIVGYSIALFTQPNGNGQVSVSQLFGAQQATYNFSFPTGGGCPSANEIATMASLGLARYVMINNPTTNFINLNDVVTYDCNGNWIDPASASLSSTYPGAPASNCINFPATPDLCHSNAAPAWLMIDLGRFASVGFIEVLNRPDCCQERIIGSTIGLFAGPGTGLVAPLQTFTTTAASYTFPFPCYSMRGLINTIYPMATNLGMARYVYIFNPNSSAVSLDEVQAFDCLGNPIAAVSAQLSTTATSAFNSTFCINNASSGCLSTVGLNSWLQIDLGSAVAIGSVVVRNCQTGRPGCNNASIVGFSVGLFNGPAGTFPVGSSVQITSIQQNYTLSSLRTCRDIATISTSVSASLSTLQVVSNSNLVSSMTNLSRMVAAETALISSLANTSIGNVSLALAQTNQMLTTVSSSVRATTSSLGSLSTTVSGQIALLQQSTVTNAQNIFAAATATQSLYNFASTNIAAAMQGISSNTDATQSLYVVTSTNVDALALNVSTMSTAIQTSFDTASTNIAAVSAAQSALRSALIAATAVSPSASSVAQPFIESGVNGLIVASGTCMNDDLCTASSFAANLKSVLSSL